MPTLVQPAGSPALPAALSLVRLRASLATTGDGRLPLAIGTTLHGALGAAIKRTACAYPDPARRDCATCRLARGCPYPRLSEPQPGADGAHPPAALLHAPGRATPRRVTAGSELLFDLTLVGRAIDDYPLLLVALDRLAAAGLGPQRVPCTMLGVTCLDCRGNPVAAVHGSSPPIATPLAVETWHARFAGTTATRVRLSFFTRLRLQRHGETVRWTPTFAELCRALVRRADALARAHCGEEGSFPDPRPWLAAAATVSLGAADLRWHTHTRRSASTATAMPLDGFVGHLTYTGEAATLAYFLPALGLGEAIGIGRGCAFGNGRYRLHVDAPAAGAPPAP